MSKITTIRKMGKMSSSLYLSFFNDCFNNSKDINDVNFIKTKFSSFEEVKTFYGDYPYLVENKEECIGFFFDDFDCRSNAIGLSIYIGSSYSKGIAYRKLKTILLCGILHDYRRTVVDNIEFVELNTFSKSIIDNVKFFIPNVCVYSIRKEYILLHSETKLLDMSILEKFYSNFLISESLTQKCFSFPDKIENDGKIYSFY